MTVRASSRQGPSNAQGVGIPGHHPLLYSSVGISPLLSASVKSNREPLAALPGGLLHAAGLRREQQSAVCTRGPSLPRSVSRDLENWVPPPGALGLPQRLKQLETGRGEFA